jgi:hypothetical protein
MAGQELGGIARGYFSNLLGPVCGRCAAPPNPWGALHRRLSQSAAKRIRLLAKTLDKSFSEVRRRKPARRWRTQKRGLRGECRYCGYIRARKASRARALDSPMPGEGRMPERRGHQRTVGHVLGGSSRKRESRGIGGHSYHCALQCAGVRLEGSDTRRKDRYSRQTPRTGSSHRDLFHDHLEHADAPRGMTFLYSLNRLNVATSHA